MDATDNLPKYPYNIRPKHLGGETLVFAIIKRIQESSLSVSFPGGHTGFVNRDNMPDQLNESVDLASVYKVGESILASVVNVTARLKVRLTIKPEIISRHIPTQM